MHGLRRRSQALILGLAWAMLSCSPEAADTPAEVATDFYRARMAIGSTGVPTTAQLDTLAPFLSAQLRLLLQEARVLHDAQAAAHPDEKPAFADGDLFSSLFEGPTGFAVLAGGSGLRVAVELRDDRATPPVTWSDTVVVQEEGGRLVVADIVYGATWDFANRGSLVALLTPSRPGADSTPWTLRLDGIGPVRVGMTIAEVERLLGATARIDRIEPDDECGYAYLSTIPTGLSLMLSRDTVVRVNVDTSGFLDEAGLGVGSTETEVLARRAGRVRVEPHYYTGPEGHYLIVDDPARPGFRLIYETDGQRVLSVRAGRLPEAELVEGCA